LVGGQMRLPARTGGYLLAEANMARTGPVLDRVAPPEVQ
jgi:hypothetical protein